MDDSLMWDHRYYDMFWTTHSADLSAMTTVSDTEILIPSIHGKLIRKTKDDAWYFDSEQSLIMFLLKYVKTEKLPG